LEKGEKRYKITSKHPKFPGSTSQEVTMFDSLADRIRHDEHEAVNNTERTVRYLITAVVAIVLFAGLYFGIRMLEG
jgi:hypothetical protein